MDKLKALIGRIFRWKNIRYFIILGAVAVFVGIGIANLHVESVSEHDRAAQETAQQVQENPDDSAQDSDASSEEDASADSSAFANEGNTEKAKETKEAASSSTSEGSADSSGSGSGDYDSSAGSFESSSSGKKNSTGSSGKSSSGGAGSASSSSGTGSSKSSSSGSASSGSSGGGVSELSVSIDVRCDAISGNGMLTQYGHPELESYAANPQILSMNLVLPAGSSVYDALCAATSAANVQLDATYSAAYKTAYIRGIHYLYEQMTTRYSGWMYSVNGTVPNVGASSYQLSDGDVIHWYYVN